MKSKLFSSLCEDQILLIIKTEKVSKLFSIPFKSNIHQRACLYAMFGPEAQDKSWQTICRGRFFFFFSLQK